MTPDQIEEVKSQPLREAVSWNDQISTVLNDIVSQPLREAVSWNFCGRQMVDKTPIVSLFVRLWVEILCVVSLQATFQSASSWGCELKYFLLWKHMQVCWSASSWGCELKLYHRLECFDHFRVSLFVRLWVEISLALFIFFHLSVSLFVRLWVEISKNDKGSKTSASASSWGCELKCSIFHQHNCVCCQPLREAVSWNMTEYWKAIKEFVSLFVRLWVEITSWYRELRSLVSQPLREAVSWNVGACTTDGTSVCQPLREAVSWNNS